MILFQEKCVIIASAMIKIACSRAWQISVLHRYIQNCGIMVCIKVALILCNNIAMWYMPSILVLVSCGKQVIMVCIWSDRSTVPQIVSQIDHFSDQDYFSY